MDQEIRQILADLMGSLQHREERINKNGQAKNESKILIADLKQQIRNLEISAEDIFKNYPDNPDMLFNIKKRVQEIKEDFDKIGE